MEEKELTLLDTIHRCILCNSPAYEVNPGYYECINEECEFSWRVTDCNSDA